MSTKYGVHSFHISGGAGDAAIHLLVQKTSDSDYTVDVNKGGIVLGACWLDGGPDSYAPTAISRTLYHISSIYEFPNGALNLDSIVISHWDNDHYGGTITYIQANLQQQMDAGMKHANPQSADAQAVFNTLLPNLKFSFAKYNGTTPATYLVCPYWFKETSVLVKTLQAQFPGTKCASNHSNRMQLDVSNSQVAVYVEFEYEASDGKITVKGWAPGIFKMICGPDMLLGRDLLNMGSGIDPSKKHWSKIANYTELLDANNRTNNNSTLRPGLYIVAADTRVVGVTPSTVLEAKTDETTRERDISLAPRPHGIAVIDGNHSTSNRTSIIALTIWHENNLWGRITSYTAGDAEWQEELAVAQWTRVDGSFANRIPVMKLSHHGADSSSPTYLLDRFNSSYIVVSCGTKFRHPKWEVLAYIDAVSASRRNQIQYTPFRPFLPMGWPYWLARNASNDLIENVGIKTFTAAASSQQVTFRDRLLQVEAAGGSSVWKDYLDTAGSMADPSDELAKRITQKLKDNLTAVTETMNVRPSESRLESERSEHTVNDILYHWIEMTFRETKSKFVYVKDANIPSITCKDPPKSNQGRKSYKNNRKGTSKAAKWYYTKRRTPKRILTKVVQKVQKVTMAAIRRSPRLMNLLKKTRSFAEEDRLEPIPPPIPLPTNPEPQDDNFYILSSLWPIPQSTDVHVTDLTEGSDLDNFVIQLPAASIALDPVFPSSQDGLGTPLIDGDYWLYWMQNCGFQATNIYVNATSTGLSQYDVEGFSITLGLKQPLSPGATPYKITFSTSNTQDALDTSTSQVSILQSYGIMKGFAVLIAGLNTDPAHTHINTETNISDLIRIFEMDVGVFGLAEDLMLKLDSSKGSRNAIWYAPLETQDTFLRLQFTVSNLQSVQNIVDDIFGKDKNKNSVVGVKDIWVVFKSSSSYMDTLPDPGTDDTGLDITTDTEMILSATFVGPSNFKFSAYLDFLEGEMAITLRFSGDASVGDILSNLETMLADAVSNITGISLSLPNISDYLKDTPAGIGSKLLDTAEDAIMFRQVVLTVGQGFNFDGSLGRLRVKSIQVTFEVGMNIGQEASSMDKAAFFLIFNWPAMSFIGSLSVGLTDKVVCDPPLLTPDQVKLMPWYEDYRILEPSSKPLAKSLKLNKLIPLPGVAIPDPPNFIPNDITVLSIEVGRDVENNVYLDFQGTIETDNTADDVPTLEIEYVFFHLHHNFGNFSDFLVYFDTSIILTPRTPPAGSHFPVLPPASLTVKVSDNPINGWQLYGEVQDLTAAHLYSVVERDSAESMMDILQYIGIQEMSILYKFGDGKATMFDFNGVLLLDILELDFFFHSEAIFWSFDAYLKENAENPAETTLFDVLKDILGSGVTGLLPQAANIPIRAPAGADKDLISLHVKKHTQTDGEGNETSYLAMSLRLSIGDGKAITFVQLQPQKATHVTAGQTTTSTHPKRLLRFSVGTTPDVHDIPLVGSIPQAYDEMDFIWVGGGVPATGQGFTLGEINLINNQVLIDVGESIRIKMPENIDDMNQFVLLNGCHFMVVLNDKVVLDYLFGQPSTASVDSMAVGFLGDGADSEPEGSDTTMAPMKKSLGPLTVSNVGIRYHDNVIWVVLDATVALGPIEFKLIKFGVGINISSCTLDSLPTIEFSLGGLGVEFDEPPVALAGLFLKRDSFYLGGITVDFDPYSIMAVGAYGTATDANKNQFKTFFVYGEVEGPLVQLEVAEITGLKLGFGYNSAIKNPDFKNISYFPFTAQAGAVAGVGNDPLQLMSKFTVADDHGILWIVPTNGSLWLAAGLRALALEVIQVSAIVIMEFNPAPSLCIFGDAVGSLPFDAPGPSDAFLYIEFGLIACLDFAHGTFIDQAQLTANSFVLSPSCHLTGGYAIATWFGGSSYAGERVYTIGGYHPRFSAPSYYPEPPRLGISWNLDGCISINGEAYFAITTKSAMGGVNLNAAFNAGPLSAHFSAWADFLINYHPFFFTGSCGISVGVSFTLDLWIVTIHINVDIGASLYLHGPPFQGTVHVDFWVFGFDINFGSGELPHAIDWDAFWKLLCSSNMLDPNTQAGTSDPNAQLVLALQTGGVASKSQMQDKKLQEVTTWLVRAGSFSFQVQTRFPMTKVTVNGQDEKAKSELLASDYTCDDIYSKPMHTATNFDTSEMTIEVDGVPYPFRVQQVMKKLPKAFFDKYDYSTDPTTSSDGNYVLSLLSSDAPCSYLMAGVTLLAPKPIKGDDTIPTFNAIKANSSDVNTPVDPPLPVTPSLQGVEFTPEPHWPPETAEQIRSRWSTAGMTVPNTLEVVEDGGEKLKESAGTVEETEPTEALVESFTEEWETIFGWPTAKVLDKMTKAVVQRPLVWQPPSEKLLLSDDTWGEYYVSEPRMGAQTLVSAA